jgi:hypothetical protein
MRSSAIAASEMLRPPAPDAAITTLPAMLLILSSCPPGAWSMLSLPLRAVLRSSPTSWAIAFLSSSKSTRHELIRGKSSTYSSDLLRSLGC